MSTTSIEKPLEQAAFRLIKAVKLAPLEELRTVIKEDIGLNPEARLETGREDLFEQIADLKNFAMLGYPGAIDALAGIATDISSFLGSLVSAPHSAESNAIQNALESIAEQESEDDQTDKKWLTEIDEAASQLYDLAVNHLETCEAHIQYWQSNLVYAPFSFPLKILSERSEPPTPPLEMVSDFCDRLIQTRLNFEIRDFMLKMTTKSKCWPVVVHAEQYESNFKLKEFAPDLRLGESLPIKIFSMKTAGSPKELATKVFGVLENEREWFKSRAEAHQNELRSDEQNSDYESLDKFIEEAEAAKRRGETLPPNSTVKKIWLVKAVLLPELRKETVEYWVEAAYALAISECNGDFSAIKWTDCIENRLKHVGSMRAALRSVLGDGFKRIAKN